MNRRNLLVGAGAALSTPFVGRIPALSGGTNSDGNDGGDAGEIPPFQPDRVQTELEVGSRKGVTAPNDNRPHGVVVWNATPDTATVEVRIIDTEADRTVLELTSELSADAAIEFALLEPSTYRLRVRNRDAEATETMEVPRSWFDCNGSSTQVSVLENGRIESQMVTTLLACTDATVTGTPTDDSA